jgi:replicative DNA helicase
MNLNDIESSVIGILLIDSTAISRLTIQPNNLENFKHQEILESIIALGNDNKPINLISVNQATNGKYIKELSECTTKLSSKSHLEYYCSIIKQAFVKRELIRTCQETILKSAETNTDPFAMVQELASKLDDFSIKNSKDFIDFNTLASTTIKELEAMQSSGKSINGLDTGFTALNRIGHGWHSPDLVIIAARPATGKTAFALNLAVNLAVQKHPVAFFSCEMSSKQLAMRVISSMTGVYGNYLAKAELHEGNWNQILKTNFNLPLYIDDTPSLNLLDFKEKARKAKKKYGIKAIFVDYLQLLTVYGKGNREQEISTISRTFKAIAKELDVPVIALAQLSRDVEKRNGEPRLSDLRESGAIEQDADIVIALHNHEEDNQTPSTIDTTPIMRIIYLKHRNGEVGFTKLKFDKSKQKFLDI